MISFDPMTQDAPATPRVVRRPMPAKTDAFNLDLAVEAHSSARLPVAPLATAVRSMPNRVLTEAVAPSAVESGQVEALDIETGQETAVPTGRDPALQPSAAPEPTVPSGAGKRVIRETGNDMVSRERPEFVRTMGVETEPPNVRQVSERPAGGQRAPEPRAVEALQRAASVALPERASPLAQVAVSQGGPQIPMPSVTNATGVASRMVSRAAMSQNGKSLQFPAVNEAPGALKKAEVTLPRTPARASEPLDPAETLDRPVSDRARLKDGDVIPPGSRPSPKVRPAPPGPMGDVGRVPFVSDVQRPAPERTETRPQRAGTPKTVPAAALLPGSDMPGPERFAPTDLQELKKTTESRPMGSEQSPRAPGNPVTPSPGAPSTTTSAPFASIEKPSDQPSGALRGRIDKAEFVPARADTPRQPPQPWVRSEPPVGAAPISTPVLDPFAVENIEQGLTIQAEDPVGPRTETGRTPDLVQVRSDPARAVQTQVTDAARRLADGSVEVQLSPEELGRVKLTVSHTDGDVVITALVERAETLELMRRNAEGLSTELRQAGFERLNLNFAQNGERGSASQSQPSTGRTPPDFGGHPPLDTVEAAPPRIVENGRLDIRL